MSPTPAPSPAAPVQFTDPHSARPAAPSTLEPPAAPDGRAAARAFDQLVQAGVAKLNSGLSPVSLALAFQDWTQHLMLQPAETLRLATAAQAGALEWAGNTLGARLRHVTGAPASTAPDDDPRFAAAPWKTWPWIGVVNAYHEAEHWWREATQVEGMSPHHAEVVRCYAQQWLDMLSPSNLPINPEVASTTAHTLGANLAIGAQNALNDWRTQQGLSPLVPPEHPYLPGVDVAITPGAVVMRNRLVELIQYSPSTETVAAEPVFIVPSWIMKYYILDLSAHNSMVRWLVSQGHTVFIMSWHNPTAADADLGLNDYLQLGVFDSLAAIRRLLPEQKVHACGYCLGGTLLAIAAAALARPEQVSAAADMAALASVTLLAAETDFKEPGEMGVLVDDSQVQSLEAMMNQRGFLTGPQMAGSFQFLHSRELVWSTRMREYLLGERSQPNDLMAWNADTTRMPARMHSEYLRRCYLANALAEGRYEVENHPVSLSDIRLPMFCVGTEKDHVSPWKSVYKIHRLTETELSFVLTSGGHNAGIVSEPGHAHRHYQIYTTGATDAWLSPEEWQQAATPREGSWWEAWQAWLVQHSSGEQVPARVVPEAAVLTPAPGLYVQERYND